MSSTKAVIALFVLLMAPWAAMPARADSQIRIVRLSLVDGTVQIDRATGQGYEKAIMNMPVTQGTKLRTAGDARAEVEFEDGTTLRLASDSEVEFPVLSLRSDGGRVTAVHADRGTAYFDFRHKKDDDFRVAFAGKEIALDRSVHFRLTLNNDEAQIAVYKGDLTLKGPVEEAKVKKQETLTLDLRDANRYDLAKGIAPESDDRWDSNRIEYHDYYSSASYSHSPYYYGRSDLSYYGGWSSLPGYGMVWRPYDVAYGWDPFSYGAWTWYPGFGYTFVSMYPWGWTPYRYGSWVFAQGFGWCWRPGGWNNWYQIPPVYNAPPAYRTPQPPAGNTLVSGGTGAPVRVPPTVIVGSGGSTLPGRKKIPGDDDAVVPRTGPAGGIPAPTAAAPVSPTPSVRTAPTTPSKTMVPGPNGPVPRQTRIEREMASPRGARMGADDAGFRGGHSAIVDRPSGAQHAPPPARMSAPAPRISSPPPPPPPPPAPAPARSQSSGRPPK